MNTQAKAPQSGADKILDWMDVGWRDFEDRMLEGDELDKQRRLLKEAWLHGARTAVAKVAEQFPDADGPCDECRKAGAVLTCIHDHDDESNPAAALGGSSERQDRSSGVRLSGPGPFSSESSSPSSVPREQNSQSSNDGSK
jgi:hypothetical protein